MWRAVRRRRWRALWLAVLAAVGPESGLRAQASLPGTAPLPPGIDLTKVMVEGIDAFLEKQTAASVLTRDQRGQVDASSREAWEKSLAPKRERFAKIIGAIDPRVPQPAVELIATTSVPAEIAVTNRFTAYAVRWPVLAGVTGEGLLLQPKGAVRARVVAIPDADQTPEVIAGLAPGLPVASQFARRLAENGVQVLIPTLADRSDTFSGSDEARRWTNLPHREWIYRQAYILGRHVIGYEVQKVRAAVDWLARQDRNGRARIGVVGWGEGGLLALYTAALEPRVDATLVSGYFSPREQLWQEPIYRNLFGLLDEFGDAEIAGLIAPRALAIEAARAPEISGPPPARAGGKNTAAPGRIVTPAFGEVRAEVERARRLAGPFADALQLCPKDATASAAAPLSDETLRAFLPILTGGASTWQAPGAEPNDQRSAFDPLPRQERVVREMERFSQRLLQLATARRDESFWAKESPTTPSAWRVAMRPMRDRFREDVIGYFPLDPAQRLTVRARVQSEQPGWTEYEVQFDTLPGVSAWGYLLVPKNLAPGESRPVVVAQHGLNSTPADVINPDPTSKFFEQFHGLGTQLVQRGFIVFAPCCPWGGSDFFRGIQRRANPLGKSIFSFVVAEHARLLTWLGALPFVDRRRIGFYGLSYGGKTALRVPAILDGYAAVVCSGDFNEWIWKTAGTDSAHSYVFTNEYEMPEFDLGMTFSHAEMAAMIAPRPFMVERGHDDTVSTDEWVAFEYARVARLYAKLGIPERTAIEYFVGPHSVHGVGTFQFLHRFLNWPEPAAAH